ncbi:MAG: LysR family transcriptional regulator, partial [Paracoccus sp. (in: a-proteobacteria)]|nr:LysR family transcriptional regulator [Paracoccus sp. (in: a-proteobacteria)]
MSINLNDLRLFVEIVEHRGILRAARALGLPKSTISRRLVGLEEQLRTRLIVRSAEGFTLTAAGKDALRLALPMVASARAAEDRLLAASREIAGPVIISISPAL